MLQQASPAKATGPTILRAWPRDTGARARDRDLTEGQLGAETWHHDPGAGVKQIRFGPFLLDCPSASLFRDGIQIRVRSQVYEVIKVLASRLGGEVRFADLMEEAWRGTSVSHHTVVVTIAEARKALGEYRNWIVYLPNRGYRLTIPVADDQMKVGWRMAQRCTREGLEKALERFRVAAADRFDRRPLDAIARACLMLGACGSISPTEALAAFQPAYQKAVDLFGLTPALRADRAHAAHLFERNRDAAEREFLESARNQEDSTTFLRLTSLYIGQRRFDCALESLERARSLDRFDPALPAVELFLWLAQNDFQRAVRVGAAAIEIQPYFYLDRSCYGQALEFSGHVDEALEQYRLAQTLAPDIPWLKALEAHCLARSGRSSQAEKLLAKLQRVRRTTYVDPLYLVPVLHALHCRDEAFSELWRARNENSASLYSVDVDPKLAPVRADRRFAAFRRGLFRS